MYPYEYVNTVNVQAGPGCITQPMMAYHDLWRLLWEQHVAWTRMVILSVAFSLPNLKQTSTRLLRNAGDMGAAMRQYYGDAIAAGFAHLIYDHLLIAIRLVSAAKAGDTAGAAQAEKDWYANADDIARFLAGINPYLPEQTVKDMLYTHLALTKTEAVATISGDYQKSIDTYDQIELQALGMADAISGGIMKQFPWLFA